MPGLSLTSRLRRSKAVKHKQAVKPNVTNNGDRDSIVFDPREFNPFDQPNMKLESNGRPKRNTLLDLYTVIEPPHPTIWHHLHRSKTVRAAPTEGYPLCRVSRHEEQPPQLRSFEKISGSHSPRPGSTFVGPSHWVNPEYEAASRQVNEREAHMRPFSWPPGQTTQGASSTKRAITQHDANHNSSSSREDIVRGRQPKVISPKFKRAMPILAEGTSEHLWMTAAQILGPSTTTRRAISSNQTLELRLKRRASNRSPDSGIGVVGDLEGKENVDDKPQSDTTKEKKILMNPIHRPWSHPSTTTHLSHDSSKGQQDPTSSSQSFDETRLIPTTSPLEAFQDNEEIEAELEAQARYRAILARQEALKEEATEGHLRRIHQAAKQWPNNLAVWDNTIGNLSQTENTRLTNARKAPKVQIVGDLRFVSQHKWAPLEQGFMTTGLSAEIEDVRRKGKGFKKRFQRWVGGFKTEKGDCIFECPVAKALGPEVCWERRKMRRPGAFAGQCC